MEIKSFTRHLIGEYAWTHRNTILFILSILLSYILLTSQHTHDLISSLGNFGYLGSFIVGMFYTYTLTVAPATIGLFILGETLNPLLLALTGAAGAVLSDYIIYRFVKDTFVKELEEFPAIKRSIHNTIKAVRKSKVLKHYIPFIAGLIIASPLPDELGAGMLGMIKFRLKKFLMYSYFFNFLGILIITTAAKLF